MLLKNVNHVLKRLQQESRQNGVDFQHPHLRTWFTFIHYKRTRSKTT